MSTITKRAKILFKGTEYSVTVGDNEAITLPNGDVVTGDSPDVEWLPLLKERYLPLV